MNMKRILPAFALASTILPAVAQTTAGGFFTDGYLFRHQINPAQSNETSYFSMPLLGNFNMSQRGNVSLTDFFYTSNGKTVTFMHPDIKASEALKPFDKPLQLENDMTYQLFSFGTRSRKAYWTFDVNLRSNVGMILPNELFRMLKEGPANKTYDFSDFKVNANAYGEVALGYSRQVNRKLEIGGKIKFLAGLANVKGEATGTELRLNENKWDANVNATVNASFSGLSLLDKNGKSTKGQVIDDLDFDGFGLAGYGAALDLGFTYKIGSDWQIGLAFTDLGMISWNENVVAENKGYHDFDVKETETGASFDKEFDYLGETLDDIYQLKIGEAKSSRMEMLATSINASVEYTIPAYRKLTLGLLSTTRLQESRTWTEARLSANFAPAKWFSMSVSGAAGTFGPSFGWILNLHPHGFNLFAAMDYLGTPFSANGIPCGNNAQINVGLNFPLR